MRNLIVFICIGFVLVIATIIGSIRESAGIAAVPVKESVTVPHIGSVQVLNGCGAVGGANKMADFLRERNFDVKSIGNAECWNYPFTMVIARNSDMSIASQVAKTLKTDKVVLVRNTEQLYDATVVIGPDYGERIQ